MRARGFTLLEVLIALLVVAITLSAATAAVGGAARRQRGLEERTFATWAAQNTLNRLRLDGLPREQLDQTQTLAGQQLRVGVQARAAGPLRRVELAVRRADEAEPVARLTGFLPVPILESEPVPQQQPMLDSAPGQPPDLTQESEPMRQPEPELAP